MSDQEFEEPVVESDLLDVDESVVEPELEPEPELELEVEAVVEPEPEPIVGAVVPEKPKKSVVLPLAVDINAVYEALPEPAGPAVVGLGEVDDVYLSSCIYQNEKSRKSLTIHHLQRRLVELGFAEAGLDKNGYYGPATQLAIENFQAKKGIEKTNRINAETFQAIFKGDKNVKVHV